MGFSIQDGSTGVTAKVDSRNRIQSFATSQTRLQDAVDRGKTWNVGTGQMTLTSANASAVMYLENTGADLWLLELYVFLVGSSSGGTGRALIEILRNPSGGSIVSGATNVDSVINMNFSSAQSPNGNLYKGAEALTLTGQDGILRSQINGTGPDRVLLPISTILPQGGTLGIRYTPPSSNTSQVVEAVVEMSEIEAL